MRTIKSEKKCLIYYFIGKANDLSDILPSERFATIAGIIKEKGHTVEIWDGANSITLLNHKKALLEDVERLNFEDTNTSKAYKDQMEIEYHKIINQKFDVIFVNLWRGPGFKFTIELIEKIKKNHPHIKIIAIGQGIDRIRELTFETAPNLDAVLYGLGYESILPIINNLKFEEIPNLIYKKEGKITFSKEKTTRNLNELPMPIYTEDVYKEIKGKIPVYPLTLSNEACPYNCPFCMRPASYGTDLFKKNIERTIAELKHLMFEYGIRHFRMIDSTPPYRALTEFAQAILDEGLDQYNIQFSGFSRLDASKGDDFKLLSKAGFKALFFGIETLDDTNQKNLNKVFSFERLKNTLQEVHDAGIITVGSFIFPLPKETEESMNNTLSRLRELKPILDSILIAPSGVFPNTDWRNNPEKYGIVCDEDYDQTFPSYPIKYVIPMRLWKPFPFRYEILGKPAKEVQFIDIVNLYEKFVNIVLNDIKIPMKCRDYDVVTAHLLGKENFESAQLFIDIFSDMNYTKMQEVIDFANEKVELIKTPLNYKL